MRVVSQGDRVIGTTLVFDKVRRESTGVVVVTIDPVGDPTRDANGRLLHCLLRFARPEEAVTVGFRQVAEYAADGPSGTIKPVDIECDAGTYYLPSSVALFLTGGTEGDAYDVTITSHYPRCMPSKYLEVWLTSLATSSEAGIAPIYAKHQNVCRVLAGSAQLAGLSLGTMIPVSRGQPVRVGVGANCVYQTGVRT